MDADSRRMPRRDVAGATDVIDAMTGEVIGHLGNLSVGGMLLIANSPALVEDALYQLRFTLPGEGGHELEVGAHALWRAEASAPGQSWVGMRFLALSPDATRALSEWVAHGGEANA